MATSLPAQDQALAATLREWQRWPRWRWKESKLGRLQAHPAGAAALILSQVLPGRTAARAAVGTVEWQADRALQTKVETRWPVPQAVDAPRQDEEP